MVAPYLIRVFRSGRFVGQSWCWSLAVAYEEFGFAIRRPGLTAVRLVDTRTGEILAGWEVAPAIGPTLAVTSQVREGGGLGVSPNMRQPEGGSRVL